MKVLLIKDVYKLGRAGDVKKVANGYGRNYLIPQGLAILASPGALKQAETIRTQANARRAVLNEELSGIAEILGQLTLTFPVKAGETGKLYGSITPQMIIDGAKEQSEVDINRRQLDYEPIRNLGIYNVQVRLTVDLVPEMKVIVYREGETPEALELELAQKAAEEARVVEVEEQFEPVSVEGESQPDEVEDQIEPAVAEDESQVENAILAQETEEAE